jgi:hypothetical protein
MRNEKTPMLECAKKEETFYVLQREGYVSCLVDFFLDLLIPLKIEEEPMVERNIKRRVRFFVLWLCFYNF